MDATLFADDIALKPQVLSELADHLDRTDPWHEVGRLFPDGVRRVVLIGMGSSRFAADIAAGRLRARGVAASAEYASNAVLPLVDDATLVVLISATGGSKETVAAAHRLRGHGTLVALTNNADSTIAALCDATVLMHAGVERGGVACRTYQHTLVMLLAMVDRLCGAADQLVDGVRGAVDATQHLLDTETEWLPPMTELLIGPAGTHIAAPADRLSSALQSALMLREGPRCAAIGCETGDWSHIDVYLTKTTDYRLMLYGGSSWEAELLDWTTQRSTTVVSVGQDLASATYSLRYPGDTDATVALLSEVTVAELVAARLWQA